MQQETRHQLSLFVPPSPKFPSTRYQGSKSKLVDWIWEQIADLDFVTCLDAFGGTGAVAYKLKQARKRVTYNDVLRFNYYFGLALVENDHVRLTSQEVDRLLQEHPHATYPHFVQDTFRDIYYTDDENAWIDRTITNIRGLADQYKFALAFFALCQACIVKRPYNLFHRKNLYMRTAEVERSFGNKTTWDTPFEQWFRTFVDEANRAVFDSGQPSRALNLDAIQPPGHYDLVYIDTPYISKRGVGVDYRQFYHFLEGLTLYDRWAELVDYGSKHRRFKPQETQWTDPKRIRGAFDRLFRRYQDGIIVVSYRNDGIPSEQHLVSLLRRYKSNVRVEYFGQYKYVLSTNSKSKEMLLVGT